MNAINCNLLSEILFFLPYQNNQIEQTTYLYNLTNLPDLVFDQILDNLNHHDLYNLKLTCKKIKNYIDNRIFTRLTIYTKNDSHKIVRSFYLKRKGEYGNSIEIDKLKIDYLKKNLNLFDLIFEPISRKFNLQEEILFNSHRFKSTFKHIRHFYYFDNCKLIFYDCTIRI